MNRLAVLLRTLVPVLIAVAAPAVATAQTSPSEAPPAGSNEPRSGFVLDERPSLRLGSALRLDLTSKLDFESRAIERGDDDPFQFGRRRIGVEGRLLGVFGFEVERELGDRSRPWRDVFGEYRQFRAVRLRGGRFKIPFGAERLTSIASLDFVQRTAVTEALTPGRDTGVQLSGRLFGSVLDYATGVFQHDGDVSRQGTESPGGRTVAARMSISPFASRDAKFLRSLEAGVAATSGEVPEGLNGPRILTGNGFDAFAPVYVGGSRRRLAVHASASPGPVTLQAEFIQARDQRLGQGLGGEDLPPLTATGWYASGTWLAIGRLKSGGSTPRTPLFGGGIGAVQFAARIERLAVRSNAPWDQAFRNPRAANILPNDLDGWVVGVNWLPVRFVKLQFNLLRERLGDEERRPEASHPWTTTRVFRVQFSM